MKKGIRKNTEYRIQNTESRSQNSELGSNLELGMKILVIDNYDSFTYNLVQYLGILGCDIQVHRNDAVTLADITKVNPDRIVISPGPGLPCNAGICVSVSASTILP